jgi:hypothetical protein
MEAPAAPPPGPPKPEPPEPPPTPPPGPGVPVISAVLLLIAASFTAIAGWFFDIANRVKTVWWVGDMIGDWFEYIAHVFEAIEDAFEGVADWTTEVVGILAAKVEESVDFLARIVGLENWREGVDTALTWVGDLHDDFKRLVLGALGDTWLWVEDLYGDFKGLVLGALGTVWEELQDMHSNFTSWVTGALGGTWEWLTDFVNDPMSKLSLDILELVKSGFEWLTQEWFSFIDTSWDTFKGSFEWLLQKLFLLLDESWSDFEELLKWFLGRCMDLVGDAAEDLKYQIWEMVEKVVKRL